MILTSKPQNPLFRSWHWIRKKAEEMLFKFLNPGPLQIGLFGLKGAGKTVYIATYYQYLREHMGEESNAVAEDERTSQYIYQTLEKISQGQLEGTQMTRELRITIHRKADFPQTFRLHTHDIPGRNFEELQDTCNTMLDSQGLLFLIDPMSIDEGVKEVYERVLYQLSRSSPSLPIAFIFSKVDHPEAPAELHEDMEGEESEEDYFIRRATYFARKKLPGSYKMATTHFQARFYALSFFGDWMEKTTEEGEKILVPDPDKPPLGLQAPMEWLYQTIYARRKKRFFRKILILAVLCALLIALGIYFF